MKLYTSYFAQIRNMPSTMLPMSTAMFPPKWFVEPKPEYWRNSSYYNGHRIYTDGKGRINGMVFDELVPKSACECPCSLRMPANCAFLRTYRRQLDAIDVEAFKAKCKAVAEQFNKNICILFFEKPDNACSERVVFKQWCKDNCIEVEEFDKNNFPTSFQI